MRKGSDLRSDPLPMPAAGRQVVDANNLATCVFAGLGNMVADHLVGADKMIRRLRNVGSDLRILLWANDVQAQLSGTIKTAPGGFEKVWNTSSFRNPRAYPLPTSHEKGVA